VVLTGVLVFAEPLSLYRLFAIGLIVAGTAALHQTKAPAAPAQEAPRQTASA
jgi:multidrug transporter EmrE-like cation transporter